jgi:hypothetical protein
MEMPSAMRMRVRNYKSVGGIVLQQPCQSLKMPRRMEERGSVNVMEKKGVEI